METVKNLRVERQIFSMLPPVINKPKLAIEYPAKFPLSKVIVHEGILTDKHYMCLDIVSDLFTHYFANSHFNGKLPRRYNADFIESFAKFNSKEEMHSRVTDSNNHDIVRLAISDNAIYAYPFMRNFHFKKIAQLFEELSELTISAYLKVVYLHRVKKSIPIPGEFRVQTDIKNYYKKMLFEFKKNNFFDFENKEMWLSGNLQLKTVNRYFTTKNTKSE